MMSTNWSLAPTGTTHKDITLTNYPWVKINKKGFHYWVNNRWKNVGKSGFSGSHEIIARHIKIKGIRLCDNSAYRFKLTNKTMSGIYCKHENCFYVKSKKYAVTECKLIKLLVIKR